MPDSLLDGLPAGQRELLRPAEPPRSARLMKAVLHDEPFADPAWVFERKLDGIRCLAVRDGAGAPVRLLSRNDLSLNGRYPELATALERQAPARFALDGEVVAFDGPVTSFAKLARRRHERVPVFLYAFDVLHLDGYDTTALALLARKSLLKRAFEFHDGLRFTPHRRGDGEELLRDACRRKWEGLIAKRADSRYAATRSRDWLKLKCSAEQELVIGGYTAPKGSRTEFGALLVGHFEDGALRYAGKVGTGFDQETLRDVHARMSRLERGDSPFVDAVKERSATWVEPELVAQIGFTEWTRDGRLRHPRFLGLREDKAAREVVRERPS